MKHNKRQFNKTAASLEQQLNLLINRGLIIEDAVKSSNFLASIGLHRFTVYCTPFETTRNPTHIFRNGTKFKDVQYLYIFDRKLRLLVIDAIERIEVAFRVSISDTMSLMYGPFWYTESKNFKVFKYHSEFMNKIIRMINSKEYINIINYYSKYYSPKYPPSWIVAECLTFGTWSKAFANLKDRHIKNKISARFGQNFIILESWMKCLTDLRNLCAHHQRIWNKIFTHMPKSILCPAHAKRKFYQQACIIVKLLNQISPASKWRKRLFNLFEEYKNIPISSMGFQGNWREDSFWELL